MPILTDGAGNSIGFVPGDHPELVDGELDALRAIHKTVYGWISRSELLQLLDGFDEPAVEIQFLMGLGLIEPAGYQLTADGHAALKDGAK